MEYPIGTKVSAFSADIASDTVRFISHGHWVVCEGKCGRRLRGRGALLDEHFASEELLSLTVPASLT